MKTARFDYCLPEELIAQVPAPRRDGSRLLVVDRAAGRIAHHRFPDLQNFLRSGDCVIRNTARVIPARLHARRPGGGAAECLLLRPSTADARRWWCLLRPGRKLPPGAVFGIDGEFEALVVEKSPGAEYLVEFRPRLPGEGVAALAERLGRVPLPPYIRRSATGGAGAADGPDDRARYQTVFADPGRTVAVAAPTAGLHFTEAMLAALRGMGVRFADVVLHVGLGTFRPIETEDVADHPIHREQIEIPPETRRLLDGRLDGGAPAVRRIALGTTSLRAVEHYARHGPGAIPPGEPFRAEADLYVHPPWTFRVVDALITNFHLPRSTLLCLVAAFLTPGSEDGVDWLRAIYAEAVRERYRFLSYGDAMLIV